MNTVRAAACLLLLAACQNPTNPTVPLSTNKTLSALTLSEGVLTPGFSPTVFAYSATVAHEVASVTLTATAEDTRAAVQGSGAHDLDAGSNSLALTVTAEDGSKQVYTVDLTRESLSSDTTLSALTVDSGTLSPAFSAEVTSYTVSVPNIVTSITVTGTAHDAGAVGGASGVPQTLVVGSNVIEILVTAADGSERTYHVDVDRAAVIGIPTGPVDPGVPGGL